MASSLVTGSETLTFARRKTSSYKLSLSGFGAYGRLLAPKRVFSCGLNLSMGAGRFGPKCNLSANRPASELRLYQLIRQLRSSKRSIVEEEGGSLMFPIVGDDMHVSAGRWRKAEFQVATKGGPFNLEFLGRMVVELRLQHLVVSWHG